MAWNMAPELPNPIRYINLENFKVNVKNDHNVDLESFTAIRCFPCELFVTEGCICHLTCPKDEMAQFTMVVLTDPPPTVTKGLRISYLRVLNIDRIYNLLTYVVMKYQH